MGKFVSREWEFSSENGEDDFIQPEPGERYLKILDASCSIEGLRKYMVKVQDLANGATFKLYYNLCKADDKGNIQPNKYSRGTLVSLGKALAGKHIGIPLPDDIVGGVVIGTVELQEYQGKTYARVFKFSPADAENAKEYSDIEQYYSDEEPEE